MKNVTIIFSRFHVRGFLTGITTHDRIRHVDRWHAAQWIKGIRRNSRKGLLDYNLAAVEVLNPLN